MSEVFEAFISIAAGLGTITALAYAYRTLYLVLGLFCVRRYPRAKKQHRYGIVIAARNEQAVLGYLLDSIRAQDYPAELITTFVVADNCTDETARMAREHGAICYERHDSEHCTKGYALEFLFDCIERDFGRASFDGYLIFDADNLLRSDYIAHMNDAFDAGEDIVASYRNTKNFDAGWIAYSYGAHWLGTTRTEHRARSYLGLSTRLQGTGYLFTSALVKDGWHYTSLTEDRHLTADAVCRGLRVGYQHEAIFYDEQPTNLRIALRQRLRWARGNLIVFLHVGGKLLLELFRRLFRPRKGEHRFKDAFICYDVFMTTFPETLLFVARSLLRLTGELALVWLSGAANEAWQALMLTLCLDAGQYYLSRLLIPVYATLTEHRRMPAMPWYKKVIGCLLWPIFPLIGDICMLIALFYPVKWKPIPHNAQISIDHLHPHKK